MTWTRRAATPAAGHRSRSCRHRHPVLVPALTRAPAPTVKSGDAGPDGGAGGCGVGSPTLQPAVSLLSIFNLIASSIVKQLLLRVPDEIHRRLTARAARAGQSVNSVAIEILDAVVDADEGDRRARLRARAAALGLLDATPAKPVSSARRRRILASTRGTGAVLDRLLAEDRDRK